MRRIDNKPLPKLNIKPKQKAPVEEEKDDGSLKERDFKNPKILAFTSSAKDEEKPSWRDLEKDLVQHFPSLKILYSRMKDNLGQIAFSSHNLDEAAIEKLTHDAFKSAGYDYTFSQPSEEDLKKFWEEHGSHYEMITKQKMRRLKKRKRDDEKQTSSKIQKTTEDERQYTIAGVSYANINKVKSKAKAIMNIKEDGQKLESYEEEFMKEIIKYHPKHDEKMNGTGSPDTAFDHFIVDQHPNYRNTRCFFVVRKDGTKEDFSMSKCIELMEKSEQ